VAGERIALGVACAQTNPKILAKKENLETILQVIDEASGKGADVIIFPECALTGYCFATLEEVRSVAEPLDGPSVGAVAARCKERGVHAIVGMVEASGERYYNVAVLVGPKGLVGNYRKTHLPFLGLDKLATRGENPYRTHQVGKASVGMLICYDAAFPEASRILALHRADLVVLPTNWPIGAECSAEVGVRARAWENNIFMAACNRTGEERGFRFIGQSQIVGPAGNVLAKAGKMEETVIYAEIDLSVARNKRTVNIPGEFEINRIEDRRVDLFGDILKRYPI